MNKSRWRKMWDAALVSATGTIVAAVVGGIMFGAWNTFDSLRELKIRYAAMGEIISEKLAQLEMAINRKALDEGRLVKMEERLGDLEDQMVAEWMGEAPPEPQRSRTNEPGTNAAGTNAAATIQDQAQVIENYRKLKGIIQEQVQQQEQWRK